jgi:hypothetical protein
MADEAYVSSTIRLIRAVIAVRLTITDPAHVDTLPVPDTAELPRFAVAIHLVGAIGAVGVAVTDAEEADARDTVSAQDLHHITVTISIPVTVAIPVAITVTVSVSVTITAGVVVGDVPVEAA